jgi:hypothetical protein
MKSLAGGLNMPGLESALGDFLSDDAPQPPESSQSPESS